MQNHNFEERKQIVKVTKFLDTPAVLGQEELFQDM